MELAQKQNMSQLQPSFHFDFFILICKDLISIFSIPT